MTWLMHGKYPETPPLDRQSGRNGVLDTAYLALQLHDSDAVGRGTESHPVVEESPASPTDDSFPVLPHNAESLALSPMPSTSPPAHRRSDMVDDIPLGDPGQTPPGAPRIRDDVDLDGDIPVWDPDEGSMEEEDAESP